MFDDDDFAGPAPVPLVVIVAATLAYLPALAWSAAIGLTRCARR